MNVSDLSFCVPMYHCKECDFTFRPIANKDEYIECPHCGSPLLELAIAIKKLGDIVATNKSFDNLLY